MEKELTNLFIFIGICIFIYIVFRNLHFKEGMTTDPSGNAVTASVTNGVAGNAQGYAATIKSQAIQLQDSLLVNKYRSDYENAVLSLDDLINSLMLQTALNVNPTSPQESLGQLSTLNNAKSALNNVMKYIDSV
jgi:hypothetical protein